MKIEFIHPIRHEHSPTRKNSKSTKRLITHKFKINCLEKSKGTDSGSLLITRRPVVSVPKGYRICSPLLNSETTRNGRFWFKPTLLLSNTHKNRPTQGKQGTQPVHHPHKILTSVGELDLQEPKLRTLAINANSHDLVAIPANSNNN
jgi:hypothetical protein